MGTNLSGNCWAWGRHTFWVISYGLNNINCYNQPIHFQITTKRSKVIVKTIFHNTVLPSNKIPLCTNKETCGWNESGERSRLNEFHQSLGNIGDDTTRKILAQANNKDTKPRITGILLGNKRWPMDSPRKGPSILKGFHKMTSSFVGDNFNARCKFSMKIIEYRQIASEHYLIKTHFMISQYWSR